MNCPVCKRELAPTLSICLTCGAMMNDTVREELETKVSSNSGGLRVASESVQPPAPAFLAKDEPSRVVYSEPINTFRQRTAELPAKHTSPTLVEFNPAKTTVPDWRLQLQNSVRQRGLERSAAPATIAPAIIAAIPQPSKLRSAPDVEERTSSPGDARLAAAIRRIENSRNTFLPKDTRAVSDPEREEPSQRKFPFEVVGPTADQLVRPKIAEPSQPSEKPKLVSAMKIEKRHYDTNKLPKLGNVVEEPKNLGIVDDGADRGTEYTNEESRLDTGIGSIAADSASDELFSDVAVGEELDDFAPFAMRFGAGLFDLIIGVFATLIILSPFMIGSSSWNSLPGYFTFLGSLGIFLFLYLTASLSFWGRTFGMRLFSLELIDADANVYPTAHQAAVNSAVFLLSFAFGGLGFLTMFFSEEKRALHDIVSGTLLIRDA